MKNFKVYQQRPPLLMVEESGRKGRNKLGLPFEQDSYKANLKLLGEVVARDDHEALELGKKKYQFTSHPLVEEVI